MMKKGQQIRARPSPPPPFRAMPERKHFLQEVFSKWVGGFEQDRKPRSSAYAKLSATDSQWVKCRATEVAKNLSRSMLIEHMLH